MLWDTLYVFSRFEIVFRSDLSTHMSILKVCIYIIGVIFLQLLQVKQDLEEQGWRYCITQSVAWICLFIHTASIINKKCTHCFSDSHKICTASRNFRKYNTMQTMSGSTWEKWFQPFYHHLQSTSWKVIWWIVLKMGWKWKYPHRFPTLSNAHLVCTGYLFS